MRTKIICELASSWNGDLDLMKALIKTSAENGGDLCKLQDYRADRVPSTDPDKARYEKYEMKDEYYPQFLAWCSEYNIEPLVTCFNADRVRFLSSLGLQRVKIASISMTNKDLLLEAGVNFEELIGSTAFWNKKEIEEVNKFCLEISKIRTKKINPIIMLEEDIIENIKKQNKAIVDIIKNGIILKGEETFVKTIKNAR